MTRNSLKGALAVFCFAAASTQANATLWNLFATMDGLQEVPPNASPGFGTLTGTLDDVTGLVSVAGNYNGLTALITASHIHGLAPAGANAGVLLPLATTGGTSGTLSGGGILSAFNATGMINGLTYVNVHSQNFPGGEIRGQIRAEAVPEPATVLALVAGVGLLAARRRKRA